MSNLEKPSDLVLIEGLEVEAVIGVYDWERMILQRLVFDIELETDIKPAAAADDVALTLNYKAISDHVIDYTKLSSFKLIESLAESVVQQIFQHFPVSIIQLKLSKPGAVPAAQNVAVRIYRTRDAA